MNAYAANDAPLFGEQQQAGPVVGDLDAHSAMIMHDQLGVLGAGSSSAQWHARSHSHSKAGRRDEHDHRYADTDDDDDDEDDLEPPAFLEDDSRAQGPYRHELVNDDKHHHQQHRASSSLLSRSRSAESLSSLMRPHEAGASTTTLFLYPHHDAQPGGATARAPTGGRRGAMVAELDERVNKTYRDPGWIVIYGMTVLVVLLLSLYISLAAVRPLFQGPFSLFEKLIGRGSYQPSSRATSTPALMPALLAIPIVSLLALACSVCALAYVLVVHNAVRHLIALVLLGAPLTLVSVGLVAFYVSFLGPTTTTTTTTTQGSTVAGTVVWRVAMRVLALGACLTGVHMLRGAAARHARAERTARVLSLATGIVLAHPALLVYALALAASSLVLTLPFVSLLAALAPAVSRAEQRAHPLTPLARLCAVALLCAAYLWTLAILRAVQRAAAAGTAGEWWYAREQSRRARHRLDNNNKPRRRRSRPPPPPSIAAVDQVVASAFRRATGPSLGTVIGAAFFVALIQGLALLAARARRALVARSSAWSTHGLAARVTANVLTPALALLAGTVELYSAWAVGFAGITGDNLWDAATRTREIVRRGRAERVMESELTSHPG